jgi:hypothetical protein
VEILKDVNIMQSSKVLTPGVGAIQRKYIDSFLNYVILRVLGLLSPEEMAALGLTIPRAVEGILQYCTLGAGFAMNYTNT